MLDITLSTFNQIISIVGITSNILGLGWVDVTAYNISPNCDSVVLVYQPEEVIPRIDK